MRKPKARAGVTGRAARDAAALSTMAAAIPPATVLTLAHRLPILWGMSAAPAAWQSAELWRMTFEKPFAFWQSWCALALWPWALAARTSSSPAALAAVSAGSARDALRPVHAKVTANARRLSRRGRT